jgi:hypothetical protein
MTTALLTRGYIYPAKKIVEQVPLPPSDGQAILVKALELPLPSSVTSGLGIFQSDVIIRTAIVAALADLRANPWLLDYVFASLPKDEMSMRSYGEKSVDAAKNWFLKTKIPVTMTPRLDEAQIPCITIKLQDSQEINVTLGDTHYEPTELNDGGWRDLVGSFTPSKYNAATGIITLPPNVLGSVLLAPGMVVIDAIGKTHPIIETFDDGTFSIKQGTISDFSGSTIRASKPAFITQLESAQYRETYLIGCHVSSEPVYLTWLHSITVFVMLRYKQALLESRGFESSVINSTDFDRNDINEGELAFSRYMSITGNVRQYWPKRTDPRITHFATSGPGLLDPNGQGIRIIGAGKLAPTIDPDIESWIGDGDTIGVLKKK